MQEKILAQILPNGDIGSIISTTDPTLLLNSDTIEITKHAERERIKQQNQYFKVKNGKLIEKSQSEKDKIDAKLRPKQDSVLQTLKEIEGRLILVESFIKDLRKK